MGNLVLRNGVKILGTLPSGAGDDVLTRDGTTNEVGTVPAVDLSSYLSNSLTSAYIIVGNSSNVAAKVPMTGQVLITNAGLTTITADTIINSQINSAAGIIYSKLNLSNSIVDSDIATAAAITRTKLANGIANRILVNNGSGVMTDASAINAGFALISNGSGIPTHSSVSATVLGYLDATSSVQTQLDSRAEVNLTTPAVGDILYYDGSVFVNRPATSDGQVLTLSGGIPVWGAPTANGLPAGGTANQYLRKVDGTDYNATWDSIAVIAPGSDTEVIFNDAGVFGADPGMVYDKTNNSLTIGTARIHTVGTTRNFFAGVESGNFTNTGSDNIGIGYRPLFALTSGTSNILIGTQAGDAITSGSDNVAIGANTLGANVSGSRNVCIGDGAGLLITGNDNITLGRAAGDNLTTGASNICIGNNIDLPVTTASNQLCIQNIIFGTSNAGTGTTVSLGNIGIGTASPDRRFHVESDLATTNAVTNVQRLTVTSSGTPAAGIGVGLEFEVETAAGNNEIGARIEAVTTDVGAGTEDFDLRFYAMSAGLPAQECLRLSPNQVTAASSSFGVSLSTTGALVVNGTSGNVDMTCTPGGTPGANTFSILTNNAGGGGTNNTSSIIIKTGTSGGAGVSNSGSVFIDTGNSGPGGVAGSIGLFSTTGSFGSGQRVIFIANATTVPSTNPTGGGILYVEAGALKYRGSSGTVTTLGVA